VTCRLHVYDLQLTAISKLNSSFDDATFSGFVIIDDSVS